ncbi:hypothetical protein OGATHE_006234 [Ogataea polymorpha]|uniref:Uncharacterized protein n=1 Tax=Ogataea polymorpha TaxID=460523 RepID=A0A9P8NTP6_9ASCO|nr:hypothetical protein OGATHE_006234 [Ogataea polymorpha]
MALNSSTSDEKLAVGMVDSRERLRLNHLFSETAGDGCAGSCCVGVDATEVAFGSKVGDAQIVLDGVETQSGKTEHLLEVLGADFHHGGLAFGHVVCFVGREKSPEQLPHVGPALGAHHTAQLRNVHFDDGFLGVPDKRVDLEERRPVW